MSQEYTEDKNITLKKLSNAQRLLEALLLTIAAFAVYLMAALVSFNPSDPSWSQTAWHEPIHNLGGSIGAWLADTLLFIFGVLAYALPPIILILCWVGYRQRELNDYIDYFALSLRLIGTLALIITSCGLAALNVDDLYYFASGGVIGSLLSTAMLPWFNGIGATLALLCIWGIGLTLFTGWSWLTIAEKIGAAVLSVATFMTNRSRREQPYRNDAPYFSDNQSVENHASGEPGATDVEDALFSASSVTENLQKTAPVVIESLVIEPPQSTGQISDESALEPAVIEDALIPIEDIPEVFLTSAVQREPAGIETAPTEYLQPNNPPLYSFELPEPIESHHWLQVDTNKQPAIPDTWRISEPPLPDFSAAQRDSSEVDIPTNFSVGMAKTPPSLEGSSGLSAPLASANIVSNAFMPVSDANSQIKQGIGPELPRPNPVRIPTRRELASYGIKLPSQRNVQQPLTHQEIAPASALGTSLQDDEAQQEAILRQAFAAQQHQRYDEKYQHDDDPQHDIELARAFSQQQQARYGEINTPIESVPSVDADDTRYSIQPQASDEQKTEPWHQVSFVQATAPILVEPPKQTSPLVASVAFSSEPYHPPAQQPAEVSNVDSLIHPFLMRNDLPLEKPTTPLPTLDLLTEAPKEAEPIDSFALEQKARLVEASLADYRVKADVVDILPGPVITRFELDLAPGVKAARISNLSRDLARSLSTSAVRVVEVIPGKPYVGLELPNLKRQTVYLREVLDCPAFRDNLSPLAIVLGKDISGQPVVADLAKMPHLLVAGTTGSGKSVGVNAMILSILYKATPKEVRFIMIDPKMLELSVYEGIPHLLTDVVTDMKDAANALRWCVAEMERRYKLMSALGVRNLAGYNERIDQAEAMGRPIPDPFWKPSDSMGMTPPVLEKEPYIVVMVDEFADLIMTVGKKVEELIARLAQKARAAGIHLVLATQRPSVDVITGLIKANIPTRIAFTVSSKIDSRTILDQAGAESLLGMGDMLYLAPNSSIPVRVHGAFVRDQEVHAVVKDWKARERPHYKEGILSGGEDGENGSGGGLDAEEELDPLFDQAVEFVVDKRRASISGVQRQFRIGYNRAARIIEQMETQGIVSEQGHNGNREVLAPPRHD